MSEIRTRFAPSPTGPLHIGGARSALFNCLFAKKHGGKYVLRIEDTDLERSSPTHERDIFESFRWLGINADESPEAGGPYGPYRQSERIGSYTRHLERLLKSGSAFRCPHSAAELAAEREALMGAGRPPIHQCAYRDQAINAERAIVRFKTPPGRALKFRDLIRGEISFQSDLLGDFSLAKDLKTPLYNFAVVIDDAEMAISHVIRGEDHISNTPKQLLIQEALGLMTPLYAHLPLILGPDRSKLSKRHGATSIRELREQGYLPDALVNFTALLGWNPGDDRELFSLAELIERFDLGKVQKAGAAFNIEKLDWMNGEYIRAKTPSELAVLLKPYLAAQTADEAALERAAAIEQPRLKKLADFPRQAEYFFREPDYPPALLCWKGVSREQTRAALERIDQLITPASHADFTPARLQEIILADIGAGDKGVVLWPLRVALSGRPASAGPFEIMAAIGQEATARRIRRAIEKISAS